MTVEAPAATGEVPPVTVMPALGVTVQVRLPPPLLLRVTLWAGGVAAPRTQVRLMVVGETKSAGVPVVLKRAQAPRPWVQATSSWLVVKLRALILALGRPPR